MTGLAQNIRQARHRKGMTQAALGAAIQVAHSTISEYEAGNIVPPLPNLYRLAEVFGISVEELLRPPHASGATDVPARTLVQTTARHLNNILQSYQLQRDIMRVKHKRHEDRSQ